MLLIDKKSPIPYYDQLAELLRHEIGQRLARGETYNFPPRTSSPSSMASAARPCGTRSTS